MYLVGIIITAIFYAASISIIGPKPKLFILAAAGHKIPIQPPGCVAPMGGISARPGLMPGAGRSGFASTS
jgi:hypothetical protein